MARRDGASEFIRGPKWRTRTTPTRRATAAAITFAPIVLAGGGVLLAVMWLLDRLGAPSWVVVLPWLVPTVGATVWALRSPHPAIPTDDDDDSWAGYSIRWVMVGGGERRAAPIRTIAAVVFGAPVAWALLVWGLATLSGIV